MSSRLIEISIESIFCYFQKSYFDPSKKLKIWQDIKFSHFHNLIWCNNWIWLFGHIHNVVIFYCNSSQISERVFCFHITFSFQNNVITWIQVIELLSKQEKLFFIHKAKIFVGHPCYETHQSLPLLLRWHYFSFAKEVGVTIFIYRYFCHSSRHYHWKYFTQVIHKSLLFIYCKFAWRWIEWMQW